MSEDWAVVPDEMVSRESPPRILKELQDITTKLLQEFSASGEPITDDNHVLHRLCVKLEYLLQTCMREKTILGGNKHYWHWMYDSLKRTKRLSDGLRFVQANKEVRTSQGKGRALIRYSLVHQTLADSFQNCLMNQSTCTHFLKPMCILMRPSYTSLLLNALYDINAVNFDLISKGYDLDTAWPTFASKRYNAGLDQWRLPADRTTSLGSLGSYVSHITSASMLPDASHMRGVRSASGIMDLDGHGTISSGPPSVDQRVEELVLELNESDQKMQEQEVTLKRLENDAKTAATSASEKQDILARVISDLESRNQNMQDAMGQMTTEFQNREQSWEIKYSELQSSLEETEELNNSLKQKIGILEEDKRNLEDTVSARMTRITSGFSGTDANSISPSLSFDDIEGENRIAEMREKLEESEKVQKGLEETIKSLRLNLGSVPERIETEKNALASSLTAKFETQEMEWKHKVDCALESATDTVITQLSNVLPVELLGAIPEMHSSHEKVEQVLSKLAGMVNELADLRKTSNKLQKHQLLQQSYEKEQESEASELIEKLSAMQQERDSVLEEIKEMSEQLVSLNEELQNMKLSREAEISDHQHDMLELKDANFHLQETVEKERSINKELAEEFRALQQKSDDTALDLKSYRQKCVDLEERLNERLEDDTKSEELVSMTNTIKELEAKISHLEEEAEEEGQLQEQCIKENEKLEAVVSELTEKNKASASLIEELQQQIEDVKSSMQVLEQEKSSLAGEISNEAAKASENLQKSSEIATALTTVTEAFENTEKQYKILNENIAKKEVESAESQMNAIKACIEAERTLAKKEYDELAGENKSRKRMVDSLEKKLETLQEEHSKLSKNVENVKDLKTRLVQAQQEKAEMAESTHAIEQEFIKMAEKLEQERENALELKNEISEGKDREQALKQEIEDMQAISGEIKAKLVQLLQEKDALWKECDELKYLQKLQEEGDDTEAKWMEDQEARYCLRCGTEFNFIVRKHHCRLCGKIFCNDCSKQWIITKSDGKHERCCLSCLEKHRDANEARVLGASTRPPSEPSEQSSPIKGNRLTIDDADFEDLSNEEGNESREDGQPLTSSADQSSIYLTPNAKSGEHSRESISKYFNESPHEGGEDTDVLVAAGDILKVPINIRNPGTTIFWRFSTDRSIDFQLSYRDDEDGVDDQALIPKCRCNSHSEPVQGEMVSKEAGVYTFEFDNRFSRFMSKAVKYSLKLKEPEE